MTRQSELRTAQPPRARAAPPGVAVAAADSRPRRNVSPADHRRPVDAGPAQPRAIPGVSIHAFCEASATAEAMQAASADRRVARAHVEVSTGGIDAAVADCAAERAPNILVVETSLPRPLMLARLEALTGRCDPSTKLILIGHLNDIGLYRELMRRGIGEYLIAPVSPTQLIDAVAGVCERRKASARRQRPRLHWRQGRRRDRARSATTWRGRCRRP